jgi:hypothetical protein
VNVKISFTPVDRPATEPLEFRKSLRFPSLPNQRWIEQPRTKAVNGFLRVDTDGDRVPDTYLPGTSNFGVGQSRQLKVLYCLDCHTTDDGCSHCVC